MNRLQAELQRLYGCRDGQQDADDELHLAGPDGRVRALVLQLAGPTPWDALAPAWTGVQADLQLPAPAIAITGSGYQLWFSLAQAVPARDAAGFLEALRRRYLGAVPADRVQLFPSAQSARPERVPPFESAPDRWSAFVAPDLAALFSDEPWLDLAPGADAQAELLARLPCTPAADWQRAYERVMAARSSAAPADVTASASAALAGRHDDPRAFLLAVMNDPAVDLRLRIEAAKALLPHGRS